MAVWKVFLFFALVALACSQGRKPPAHDPRCQSSRPPIQNPGCNKTFVYIKSRKSCAWTCGRGQFVTRNECDRICRTPVVCTWDRPFETCVKPFKVYYFQKQTGTCALDIGGCRYSGNNFPTLKECQRTCKAGKP
uniref:BPTI/Kunitz inhibitor domain-containing protein n=1 Tax=Amblyomma parvum TaxID=251391 RepID=A0A023G0N7_AMBPA